MADSATLSPQSTSSDVITEMTQMIKDSHILRDDERQYWLNLLPNMTAVQVEKLKSILNSGSQKMETLDKEYDGKLQEVGEKYLNKWDAEKAQVQMKKLRSEEAVHLEQDQAKAEDLLKSW